MSGRPDPKTPARVRLPNRRYLILASSILEGHPRCACGCGRRAQSVHHVIGGNSKEDVRENLLPLSGDGTRGCHGAFTSKHRVWDLGRGEWILPDVVAAGIRFHMETDRPDVLVYVLAKKGRDWLDAHYPRSDT